MKDVPIVTAGMAYDDPESGETFILILSQALYLGEQMKNTLLCPNLLCTNDVIVDDIPKHLAPDPTMAAHSFYIPEVNL